MSVIRQEYNSMTQATNIFEEDGECVLIPDTCKDAGVIQLVKDIKAAGDHEWNATGGFDCESWKGSGLLDDLKEAALAVGLAVVSRSSERHYLNRDCN